MRKSPTVAFILHHLSVSEFSANKFLYHPCELIIESFLKILNDKKKRSFYTNLPPHVLFVARDEQFSSEHIRVIGVMCPVFPKEFIVEKTASNKKLRRAITLAKNKGADIVVLTGFTAIASDQGRIFGEEFKDLIITTGNSLTAALCVEGINKSSDLLGVGINKSTITIIGASGDVGSACSRYFLMKARQLILCSRSLTDDSPIVKELKLTVHKNRVTVEPNVKKAIARSNIVIFCTSSYTFLATKEDFSPFTIIADVSLPHNIPDDLTVRKDIFVFDAGKAKFSPEPRNFQMKRMTIDGTSIFGCIAEGIVLTVSQNGILPNLGRGKIGVEEIQRVWEKARKAGFHLSDFGFYNKKYSHEEIENYRRVFNRG